MAEKSMDKGAEGTIFIGAGVEFKGDVTVPGCASVDGKFEGVLKAQSLIVGQTGHVTGQISVDTAEIRGAVGEHLTVQSRLVVRASGSISGNISYSKIMVEEGGVLAGSIEVLPRSKSASGDDANVVMLQRGNE